MHIIRTVAEMQDVVAKARMEHLSVGCVPTMGALHEGHGALIKRSSIRHPLTVVSVFVNPTQFGPNEDFDRYPRDLDADVHLIRQHGGTHVFAPSPAEMYPDAFATTIHVGGVAERLEGASRPGHFDGVATVVCKLFQAMLPTTAYFGQKDWQQTLVVKRMVADLSLPIVIDVVPTVRDSDGLAMSSRNRYLSAEDRMRALSLSRALSAASHAVVPGVEASVLEAIMASELVDVDLEYALAVDAHTLEPRSTFNQQETVVLLIAARVGATRLIDNMVIHIP